MYCDFICRYIYIKIFHCVLINQHLSDAFNGIKKRYQEESAEQLDYDLKAPCEVTAIREANGEVILTHHWACHVLQHQCD